MVGNVPPAGAASKARAAQKKPGRRRARRAPPRPAAQIIIGDIFAGVGGLSAGFTGRPGAALGYAIEINPALQAVLRRNNPEARIFGDVNTVKALPVNDVTPSRRAARTLPAAKDAEKKLRPAA
jgi:hypothetical protein